MNAIDVFVLYFQLRINLGGCGSRPTCRLENSPAKELTYAHGGVLRLYSVNEDFGVQVKNSSASIAIC